MDTSERRKCRRAGAELDIICYEAGCDAEQHYIGRTENVSAGGLYFHTKADAFRAGNMSRGTLLRVELSIAPTKGVFEFGGRIAGFARLLRTCELPESPNVEKCGVALEFCQPLKLSV